MENQNDTDFNVVFAKTLWEPMAVQQDTTNGMLRLPLSSFELLGPTGREYLVRTAQEALWAPDVQFFADDENPNRVTLASRAHVRARGYDILALITSPLPTLTLSLGPPLIPMPAGMQPSMAGPSALVSGG
ncbi:hypothetical protein GGR56DRAFT_459642 [Xylariaceae sp. FL0804]|nr:hypothetical protein GGR56DRAFT_459642 [Xylariaceae sp. FL0804]